MAEVDVHRGLADRVGQGETVRDLDRGPQPGCRECRRRQPRRGPDGVGRRQTASRIAVPAITRKAATAPSLLVSTAPARAPAASQRSSWVSSRSSRINVVTATVTKSSSGPSALPPEKDRTVDPISTANHRRLTTVASRRPRRLRSSEWRMSPVATTYSQVRMGTTIHGRDPATRAPDASETGHNGG